MERLAGWLTVDGHVIAHFEGDHTTMIVGAYKSELSARGLTHDIACHVLSAILQGSLAAVDVELIGDFASQKVAS